jgi:hypothetical protein
MLVIVTCFGQRSNQFGSRWTAVLDSGPFDLTRDSDLTGTMASVLAHLIFVLLSSWFATLARQLMDAYGTQPHSNLLKGIARLSDRRCHYSLHSSIFKFPTTTLRAGIYVATAETLILESIDSPVWPFHEPSAHRHMLHERPSCRVIYEPFLEVNLPGRTSG